MRALGSLILAAVGAYAFTLVADRLVGVMMRVYPLTAIVPVATWTLIAAIAFLTALGLRGAAWTIWAPCALFAGLTTHGAFIGGHGYRWIVAALVLGQALFVWWALRPTSA